jgi:hypothetical protein
MEGFKDAATSSFREAVWFNLGAAIAALVALIVFSIPVTESFGDALLIESTGLMLVGGALGVAGQGTTRKLNEMIFKKSFTGNASQSDLKAALYAITGGLLFLEGALLSLILF